MKLSILAISLLSFSSIAMATGTTTTTNNTTTTNTTNNTPTASAQQQQAQVSINKTANTAVGGSSSSSSTLSSISTSAGGSLTLNNPAEVKYSGTYKVRNTPDAPSVNGISTAPCRIAVGVSGSFAGGSLGIGTSVLDEGCDVWRDVENLQSIGFKAAAIARACDKPEIARVLGEACDVVRPVEIKKDTVKPNLSGIGSF